MNTSMKALFSLVAALALGSGSLAAQAAQQKQPPTPTPARAPTAHATTAPPAAHPATASAHEAEENEHTVPANTVPAAVKEGLHRRFPNVTVTKWSSELENGRTVYEAETREGTTHRDVLIGPGGDILEIETAVPLAQLPAAVRSAATANGQHVEVSEMVVSGPDTTYEFKIHGRHDELRLRPNGTPAPTRH